MQPSLFELFMASYKCHQFVDTTGRNQTILKGGSKSGMVNTNQKATQNRDIKLKYKLNASKS